MKNEQTYTDQQLITLLRDGSQLAFEQLFEKYSQKLYRFSLSYLKSESEAEEVVQDVFLKIWETRSKVRNETSFQSYLFTIAFNAIRKRFNKKAKDEKFRAEILKSFSEVNSDFESKNNFELLVGKLDQLIDQMPERRREIFLKRKKQGMSVNDIATTMLITPKTVENQITEAMNFLKKEFSKDRMSGLLFFYVFLE